MDEKQFFRTVAERAALSVEEAADLTRATLATVAGRVSNGEGRRLALQLPEGLRAYLPQRDRVEKFGLAELLRRVGQRTGLNVRETEAGVRAVLETLQENVDADVFEHVMAQLPGDFRTMIGLAVS